MSYQVFILSIKEKIDVIVILMFSFHHVILRFDYIVMQIIHMQMSFMFRGGGQFPAVVNLFNFFFQNHKNIVYPLFIIFIFDRCHHSLAVGTFVKYNHDSKDLINRYFFWKIKYVSEGKINKTRSNNPHPGVSIKYVSYLHAYKPHIWEYP